MSRKVLLRDAYLVNSFLGYVMGGLESQTNEQLSTHTQYLYSKYPVIQSKINKMSEEEKDAYLMSELQKQKDNIEKTMDILYK